MELGDAIQRLERTVAVCDRADPSAAAVRSALAATTELQSYISARRAELIHTLAEDPAAFPEQSIADTSGCSLSTASRETDRAKTLAAAPEMAAALLAGEITDAHVDALTRAARKLSPDDRVKLFSFDREFAAAARGSKVSAFDALVKRTAKSLDTEDDEERLDRQKRATRVRTWTDDDGMWNLAGKFDPQTGVELARQLDAVVAAKFAEQLPVTAPDHPIERVQHLQALALISIIRGEATGGTRPGAPLVVVDATQTDGAGGPVLDWGLPVELPRSVLEEALDANDPDAVVVSNGVVLHAPGRLNLGRTSRLANRAQRRALTGLYSTCAVPDCEVHVHRCKLHHVTWWEDGGTTDLDNLLPVCQLHHTQLHRDRWEVKLGPNRELTITLPNGHTMTTGPPSRGPT